MGGGGKASEHAELLRLEESGIRVAQYLTELPTKALLEKKLQEAIKLAREKLTRWLPSNASEIVSQPLFIRANLVQLWMS